MILEDNKQLKDLLLKKKHFIALATDKNKEMQKLDAEMKKLAQDVQDVKNDIMLVAHKLVMDKLEDNQMAGTIKLNDNEEIEVEVFDVVEEALKANAEQKTKLHNDIVKLKKETKKAKKAKK